MDTTGGNVLNRSLQSLRGFLKRINCGLGIGELFGEEHSDHRVLANVIFQTPDFYNVSRQRHCLTCFEAAQRLVSAFEVLAVNPGAPCNTTRRQDELSHVLLCCSILFPPDIVLSRAIATRTSAA